MGKNLSILTQLTLDGVGFNKGIDGAKEKTKALESGVNTASSSIKNSFAGLGGLADGLSAPLEGIKNAALGGLTAFKNMSPAIGGIKTALISSGIGAIVVALGTAFAALASYLKGTADGGDKLNKILGYAKGIFTAILNRVQLLGEAISLVFEGKFGEAGRKLKEAFSGGLLAEIKETANKSMALAEREDALEDKQIQNIRTEADLLKKITDLREKASDKENYNASQRLKFSKQAESLDIQLSNTRIKLAKEEYNVLTAKNALGNNTDDDNRAEAEKYAAMVNLQSELNLKKKEYNAEQKKINSALAQEIELRQKAAEELKKLKAEDTKGLKKLDLRLPTQGDNGIIKNLTTRQDAYNNSLKKSTTLWQDFGKQIKSNQVLLQNFSIAIDGITGAFSDLFSSGEANFKGFVTSILQGLQKIINGLLAQAIAGMIAGEAKKGIVGLALGAIGVAALTGIWQSKVPKFALGGIVPGASYSGDRVPILANSGEMILNAGQQANLFKQLNGSGSTFNGELTTRISGSDLMVVLNNYNRKQNKFR